MSTYGNHGTTENPCREETDPVLGQRSGWQYVRELNRPILQQKETTQVKDIQNTTNK